MYKINDTLVALLGFLIVGVGALSALSFFLTPIFIVALIIAVIIHL